MREEEGGLQKKLSLNETWFDFILFFWTVGIKLTHGRQQKAAAKDEINILQINVFVSLKDKKRLKIINNLAERKPSEEDPNALT